MLLEVLQGAPTNVAALVRGQKMAGAAEEALVSEFESMASTRKRKRVDICTSLQLRYQSAELS